MNTLLGIDLGTTGLKVALFEPSGKLIGSEYCEYRIQVPQPGWAEQDPTEWWNGFVYACRVLKTRLPQAFDALAGIGLCGQMHTQVYLDKDDKVLRPAITWMDQRSSDIVARINADPSAAALIDRETGNFASTTYTAPQIRWVQENQPDVWRRVESILLAKDYLKYLLTGRKVTDYAEASGTLLFDVARERWSQDAFDFFGIPRILFPDAHPSDIVIGYITPEAAAQTGLKVGTPVVNGSSDNSASALGAGMVAPGQVTLIIGTAGVITVCSDHPLVDVRHRTLSWHYCLPRRWVTLGIMQTAGEALHWFKNVFDNGVAASGDIFDQYNRAIETVPDGSGGLIFLPYLNGERTPYWDPYARGVYFGINLATEKAHMIKAIIEGVSFGLRHNIETVESLGIQINEVRAVGGGLKSRVWMDTLGKVLRKQIHTVSVSDTANLGNILLAGKALGLYDSYETAVASVIATDRSVYFPDGVSVYEKQYALFLELYDRLKDTFQQAAQ
jgi:xylulokinase